MIKITPESLALSALTLAIGAAGAFLGQYAGLPAPILTGPALAVTLAGLLGLKLDIVPILRNAAYVVVGVGLGALVTDEATEAITRWPIAFVAMGVGLFVTMAASQFLLAQVFGFDRKAAVLASAPGHLSYVIGLGASLSVDLPRVTIVQSLRLLTLSLIVPLFARLFGVEVSLGAIAGPDPMPWFAFFVLLGAAVIIGAIALRWKLPAALLVGAMCTSGAAHGLGWVHGGLHPMIANTGFCVLGTLIGTRFFRGQHAGFSRIPSGRHPGHRHRVDRGICHGLAGCHLAGYAAVRGCRRLCARRFRSHDRLGGRVGGQPWIGCSLPLDPIVRSDRLGAGILDARRA